ncbi:M20/M25/M40 family metallo-hydrolase [Phenylobacterium sp. NIBR 498073]|uniref:M20/M25/M40 family metallo-hydrolase n=1 Tax=Phenylobacterium sp. NIBR 498073 TaxID=3015177 RepID=UPI0022B2F892|nr:M20/M25/M40 family metallo-hydrolase [Phenylobacterium sp. NIBR 498073]WGU39474.1 M20/M25/M40 family metallo-hydrolase [Phenylobacterium sp. NIBR 498073]
MIRTFTAAALAAAAVASPAMAQSPRPDQLAFRELYKELIEINTTLSVGSCTAASEAMAARLKSAGFADADLQIIVSPDRPKDGNLVATLKGTDAKAKPILLLAHIDVVEANRADWERDPFKLVEENGFFYARGAADDKAQAAVWVDTLARYKTEGFKPKRTIRMALTCGEETPDTFNGVQYLIKNHRDLMDAAFVLNEGAGGRLDAQGQRVSLGVQAGEKVYQDYTLEVTNPGGHSSAPVRDNAIYHLSQGLARLGEYDFPVKLNDAVRGNFIQMAKIEGGPMGEAMAAVAKDPSSAAAVAAVARDPGRNSMMRTTCVATMVNAGHAPNALPQRARANVNCRILPGEGVEATREALVKALADPAIKVTTVGEPSPVTPPPVLNKQIMGPVETVSAKLWPGVPIVPVMATGATDGRFLNAVGVPTYGLTGMFSEPTGNGAHGLNEKMRVRSLYEGRDFLYEVVKLYANQK